MDETFLRLLFQERQILQRILFDPEFRLQRQDVLSFFSGDGNRLDALVRADLLRSDGETLRPGSELVNLIQFGFRKNKRIAYEVWKVAEKQLFSALETMPPVTEVSARNEVGKIVYEHLMVLQVRSEDLYIAFQENLIPDMDASDLSAEFRLVAERLRKVLFRSSSFPDWEVSQQTLITWLEDRAGNMKQTKGDLRLEKLQRLNDLSADHLDTHSNLTQLIQEEPFLPLGNGITVLPWPMPPAPQSADFPETPSFSSSSTENHEYSQWRLSGLHLMEWVETSFPEEEIMNMFSRLLSTWTDHITWRKNTSGTFWEAWPSKKSPTTE